MAAPATLSVSHELALAPAAAFDTLVAELQSALGNSGLHFEPGPGGRVSEGGVEVGRVVAWEPGRRATLEWRAASWQPDVVTEVELRVEPAGEGSRATLEHRGWGALLGDGSEVAGWLAAAVMAPLLRATAPASLGDWLTDRQARRPSGAQSRGIYADPLYHYPNFRALLAELALEPADHLLEVGCGGGALLAEALATGCTAAAVDHSADMVATARGRNAAAIEDGRLEVLEAGAERLPFADATFTAAVMTGVLGFLTAPVSAFAEVHRVLRPGGRFVCLGSDPELRGTPAAPEPMASRLRFYDEDGLAALGRDAGFATVRVAHHDLAGFAREVGVPEEHVPLFEGVTRVLVCNRR
jgi:SAM-dependent methyltransferase